METRTLAVQARLEGDHWWYAGRRSIVASLLGEVPRDALALDAGCGPGGNRRILPETLRTVALDPSPFSLELSRRYRFWGRVRGDLTRLPFPGASLDLVVAMDVLEHLDDDRSAMAEVHRVLRPGAPALLTVPAFSWMWGLQDQVSHHRRRYTRTSLLRLVRDAGLEVERATYFNAFLLLPIWLGRQVLKVLPHRLVSEGQITLPVLNGALRLLFASESLLLRLANLPFGVSIFCLARRPMEGVSPGP